LWVIVVYVALTAEHYSKKAAFYDKEAEDERTPREQRMRFAKKANWLRIVAKIAAQKEKEATTRKTIRPGAASSLFAGCKRKPMISWPIPFLVGATIAFALAIVFWS
jgi:hypothetical protein